MTGKKAIEVNCPTCGKSVPWREDERWRPFCSERCKLIDLGDWLTEEHRIAGDLAAGIDDDHQH
jgi:endogenous inhibitor of DNA gyrase (YacG/DUF329 family)